MGLNAKSAPECGESLGNRTMTASAIDEDSNDDSDEQDANRRQINRYRWPVRGKVLGRCEDHRFSLADDHRTDRAATFGQLSSESESPMLVLFADSGTSPSITGLPGSSVLLSLLSGVEAWAEIGALAALVIGAALWALGSHTQNMHQSAAGRRAVGTALVAALLIGAAPHLIDWFFNAGSKVS